MLSFAPVGWWALAPVILLPFIHTARVSSPRAAALNGFWFGFGLFVAGTYWIYTSVHVFGRAPLWVAFFLMIVLAIIMALYYALTAWSVAKLGPQGWRIVVLMPVAWVPIEWLRGWFMSGFPWMTLGYGQIDSPLSGFAPLAGVFGVSGMLVLSASGLYAAITDRRLLALGATLAILPWAGGALLQRLTWTEPSGEPISTTIVQGGVSQDRKWLRDQFRPTLELYRDATIGDRAHELIVWPEVALPATIDQVEFYLEDMQRQVAARSQTLVLGILERDFEQERVYNSVLMLGGSTRQTYRKRRLVPFGEFFPVPDFVRKWMRLMSLPDTDLSAGADEQPLLVTNTGVKLAVAICYEDAYAAEQLYALPEASLLINVSNDAWFGDTIAPHQHLEIARFRALEAGRYVVRATNNGISAFIGPGGELLQAGPQFEFVSMTRDVVPMQGSTPYSRWGNWLVVTMTGLILGGFVYQRRSRSAE